MKLKTKYYIILSSTLLIFFIIIGILNYFKQRDDEIVSESNLNIYIKEFLSIYKEKAENDFNENDRSKLNIYKNYPYDVVGTISNTLGVGIEFKKSKNNTSNITTRTTNEKIEVAIFHASYNIIPSYHRKLWPKNKCMFSGILFDCTKLTTDVSVYGTATISTVNGVFAERTDATVKESSFLCLGEDNPITVYLELKEVDKIRYGYPIIMKGDNKYKSWTKNQAKIDAIKRIESDYQNTFTSSKEFMEYFAEPKLAELATKILANSKKDDYTFFDFSRDFKELYKIAKENNVDTTFAKGMYDFLEKNEMRNKETPWWYNPYVIGVIFLILAYFIPVLVQKFSSRTTT